MDVCDICDQLYEKKFIYRCGKCNKNICNYCEDMCNLTMCDICCQVYEEKYVYKCNNCNKITCNYCDHDC